jgi:hypothetical protein
MTVRPRRYDLRRKWLGPIGCAVALALAPAPTFGELEKDKALDADSAVKRALTLATIPLVPVPCLGFPRILVTVSADTNNFNLFTAAGSPTYPANVICTINGGVTIGATSSAGTAFSVTSSWHSLTTISIVNNGNILSVGGTGGNGGSAPHPAGAGNPGGNGGDCINAPRAVTITNNGNIWAGGGGGGGGAGRSVTTTFPPCTALGQYEGGGGGGGQGFGTSPGGSFGTSAGEEFCNTRANGGSGNTGGPGGGGSGENNSCAANNYFAGNGASGGTWGNAGATGGTGSGTLSADMCGGNSFPAGGAPGSAGRYIVGNANVTWLVNGSRLGGVA